MNYDQGKYFLFTIIIIIGSYIYGQSNRIRFERITADNGLSSNYTSYIFQDKKGFLWISTEDGINRYDGYRFKHFRHLPGNKNSLSDYAAGHIYEDSKGNFWIATREGLNVFNPDTETFTHYNPTRDSTILLGSEKIVCTTEDKYGNIWIGTRNGLGLFDPKTKSFTMFQNNPSEKNSLTFNYVTSLLFDSKNNLWVGTQAGLNKFDYKTNSFEVFLKNPQDIKSISGNLITSLFEDSKGNIWVGTNSGLNRLLSFEKGKAEFFAYQHNPENKNSISNNNVSKIAEDSKGNLWIGTIGGGVNIFNPSTNHFTSYQNVEEDNTSLSENNISSICIDKFENVWIGTYAAGINKYNPTKERFTLYQHSPIAKSKAAENNVSAILIDDNNNLWLGSNGDGIKVYRSNNLFDENSFLFELKADSKGKNNLSNNNVTSIIQDKSGIIWIGTFGGGVNKYDPSQKKFEIFKHKQEDPKSLGNDFIHTIYEDSEGTIWVGTGLSGLNRYDKTANSFKRFRDNPKYPNSSKYLNSSEVTSILEDSKGYLWVGTSTGGLSRFDKKTESFVHFKHIQEGQNSISSNRINCIYEDSKGRLWIGTFSGGLNLYNEKENSFIHYLEKDGLASNTVQSITEDEKGNLWITTINGISNFDPDKKTFKNFDESDGLQGKVFNERTVFKNLKAGLIYFGGEEGLNVYSSNSINEIKKIPAIVLTDFKVFNKSTSIKYYSMNESDKTEINGIELDHDENVFSFEFAALDFTSPEKNQYRYMLEGFDKDWINSGNRREVNYTNLDPGIYIFKVKGTNSDGYWNEEGLVVNLVINPPFWKTWWAYTIYFILAAVGFFALRKYELNRVKLRNDLRLKEFEAKKLLEVDELKSRFFANISHEFRTPLTIILGSLEKLQSKIEGNSNRKELDVMKRNSSRLLQLINQLLELSRIESGNVKLQAAESDILKFLSRIVASFSSLANQKSIKLTFNNIPVDKIQTSEEILIYFDKKKLETVFYNLLSNAIKFSSEEATIDVSISKADDKVKISFLNTGIEIPTEKIDKVFDRFYQVDDSGTRNFEGTGIGLSLVKEYVELHKGKVEVESHNNRTIFTVRLPLGKNHLSAEEIAGDEDVILSEAKNLMLNEKESEDDFISSSSKIEMNKDQHPIDKTIILVVEDNPDLREMIKENLSVAYSVIEAENGIKGLKLAEAHIPDLIISDIMMPEMDGYELSRKIKTNEKTNHIPVILLTAKAETKDKLEGLETGADDYLIKPFNSDELKVRVKNLIRLRKQLREKYQSQMLIKPSEVIIPSSQKLFVDKLTSIIEKNISNEDFSVEKLCDEIGMSRTQLHRKIKAITNNSTSEFIRNFRLQRAAELLAQDAGNIAEISYQVGFSSQAYFTKTFQELYKQTPLEYKRQHSK
ncbi:two-component regulator propeller domain-containing protein [Ignavibacterium album]|uniref:hybrid sensor histidine kinase/response regulator transcription factor n=1 Tax=Ignavibacterium album TaxID=591197 RepID=UPI0026F1AF66|nr:two-component regulator propeller domain-containing protein [Ignavibacterium album]